jgi:hypothetical protein
MPVVVVVVVVVAAADEAQLHLTSMRFCAIARPAPFERVSKSHRVSSKAIGKHFGISLYG